jgi:hypothetical protein
MALSVDPDRQHLIIPVWWADNAISASPIFSYQLYACNIYAISHLVLSKISNVFMSMIDPLGYNRIIVLLKY